MKIYNLGSLNIDYVYSVDHFVSAGETISSEKMQIFPGGKGLNQSVALARAGASVIHGAKIGDSGDFLVETLRRSGVDVSKIEKVGGSCGHAIIQVNRNGENCIMLFAGTNRILDKEYIDQFLSGAGEGDILLAQNETNCLREAFEVAHSKKMKIAFNPSPFDDTIKTLPTDYVDYWFCNEIEGAGLFGSGDPDMICSRFLEIYPQGVLILTLGKSGSIYCDKDLCFKQKAYKAEAVDTTAAGDTFTGYFLSSVARGMSAEEAMDLASRASAVTVSRMGASSSIPYLEEIK